MRWPLKKCLGLFPKLLTRESDNAFQVIIIDNENFESEGEIECFLRYMES
jgi:hypothetical protein